MKDEEIQYVLEAVDQHWAFKFKTKKGFTFWICRDTRLVPDGEVGLTPTEFAQIAQDPDPGAALLAKAVFRGSTISHDAVETVGTAPLARSNTPTQAKPHAEQSDLFKADLNAKSVKPAKKNLW